MRKLILLSSVLTLAACASPGIPPGGPEDKEAPKLVGVVPDTGKTGVTPPAVIFHFDEVVGEHPAGATGLDQLFIISPRNGTPVVEWKRKDVTVRPGKGFRPNTTYVVTLLPGIADLRGNIRNSSYQTVFSTGSSIQRLSIHGIVQDLISGQPAPGAYVEAINLPDSVVYLTVADSVGEFRIAHVPPGTFRVRGIIDENKNRGLDPREAWDSVTVTVPHDEALSLFALVRDTIPPVLGEVSVEDSVTLQLRFESPLLAAALPGPADVTVQGSDSSRIPIVSVTLPLPDSTAKAPASAQTPPPRVILVRLGKALKPGAEYRITISRVTGLAKTSGRAIRVFKVATAPPTKLPLPTAAPPVRK